ncbi:MAG: hypothetical protein ACLR43_05565 [Faecalibacillus faecis]
MVQVHGVEYGLFKRSYCLIIKYTHLDFNVDKRQQMKSKPMVEDHCHIYGRYGTHTLQQSMCALDVLNQFNDFDYLYIDGQYIMKQVIDYTSLYTN